MKYPQAKANIRFFKLNFMMLAICLGVFAITVPAQRLFTAGGLAPKTDTAILAAAADLDHCENGPLTAPEPCINNTSFPSNWGNGQLGANKAHYREGESVPNRIVMTGLTNGATYTIRIKYDTTKGGKYAYDYLTSYDRTENGVLPSVAHAEPCADVISGCTYSSPHSTIAIPDDPLINPPSGQVAGDFNMWGGTIDPLGVTYFGGIDGDINSDSSRFISVKFVANGPTAVLAFGAHISTRADWGDSAILISGSSYHVALGGFFDANGGSIDPSAQDHQISIAAIYFPGTITITKLVTNAPSYSSTTMFPFTASANSTIPGFSLQDTNTSQTLGGSQLIGNIVLFGENITITESLVNGWTLADMTCTINSGGFGSTGTAVPGTLGSRTVTIKLQEGNNAFCTFKNTQLAPTAAPASVSGRAVDSFGNGIANARVTVTNAGDGSMHAAYTNPFGYYTIGDLTVSEFYVLSVWHKRYTFSDDTRTFSLNEDLADMDFVANP